MKKYTLAFALFAILPIVSAGAYQRGSYYTGQQPAKTTTYKTTKTTNHRSSGYTNTITNNFYYQQQQPARRRVSSVSNDNVRYYDDTVSYQPVRNNYSNYKETTKKKMTVQYL